MNRHRFIFSSAGAAFALKSALHAAGISPLSLLATHDALFHFWFPLNELKIPPAEKGELKKIASVVSPGMYQAFIESSLLGALEGKTDPALLPFSSSLANFSDPAVKGIYKDSGRLWSSAAAVAPPSFFVSRQRQRRTRVCSARHGIA